MNSEGTLLLRRGEGEQMLGIHACIKAIENIFRLQGEGRVPAPGILAVKTEQGGLHVKAGVLPGGKSYIVANHDLRLRLASRSPSPRPPNDPPPSQNLRFRFGPIRGAKLRDKTEQRIGTRN